MTDQSPLVLIHGGYQGAWCWDRLIPFLERPSIAVDLPGRGAHPADLDDVGIESAADSVVSDLDDAGIDRFVLVGHSLGGATLPAIASRAAQRVERLVFVATLVGLDGRSIIESMPDHLQERSRERLRREGGATSTISQEHHREQLCNDMDDEQTEYVLANVGPDSLNFFHDVVRWGGVPASVPRTYVRLGQDRSLPPDMQDYMIDVLRRAGGDVDVVDIDAGHHVMISDPAALAAVLNAI